MSRSAEDYWRHASENHPESQTASVELGRALLERGDVSGALEHLYAPAVTAHQRSDLVMMAHYLGDNELLAATVHFDHLAGAGVADLAMQLEAEKLVARLLYAAGALDHVEDALAQPLMEDPWDTEAMRLAARVLGRKGKVRAAMAFLQEARRIDPHDPRTQQALGELETRMYDATGGRTEVIAPPSPYLMHYLTNRQLQARLVPRVIDLAARFDDDPVLRYKAGVCLLERGEPGRALPLLLSAALRMPADLPVRAALAKAQAATVAAGGPSQATGEVLRGSDE